MKAIGTVESLWRYPVKSMAGEEVERAWLDLPASTAIGSPPSAVIRRAPDFPG